jgi:exonuclease III
MRGWEGSKPYLDHLLLDCDIAFIQEHMLYECESDKIISHHTDFSSIVKCSKRLNNMDCGRRIGHGGVAIMYKKSIKATEIHCNSDRISGIQVLTNTNPIHIFCVYLPQAGCIIADFKSELETLCDLVTESLITGKVIVIGDLNGHIGKEGGARGWGTTSSNGKLLTAFSNENDMVYVDLQNLTTGPTYTYISHWGSTSYLDHCIASSDLQECITKCKVHEEQVENSSDHLPISVTFQTSYHKLTTHRKRGPTKIAWDRATSAEIKDMYTIPLDNAITSNLILNNIPTMVKQFEEDPRKIDKTIEALTKTMACTSKNLPKRQYRKHLKPYWSQMLTTCSKHEKRVRAVWIAAGKPREKDNDIYKQYLDAKRDFQRRHRRARNEYYMKQHQEIANQDSISQKQFWFLVNQSRKPKRPTNVNPIKFPNGVTASEPEKLALQWKTYFENLSTPTDVPTFHADFKHSVNERLTLMEQTTLANENIFLNEPITAKEISSAIKSLKKGKAGGHDGLVSEHIKYASVNVHDLILKIMNAIISYEYIPDSFRYGICIPLHKGGKKTKDNPDHYRKITLLPTLSKLFETLLLNRADKWLIADNKLGELQGAAHEGASCLHTSLLLRETIHHRIEEGETTYVAFLDAKKAFDSVWVDGLFVKIFDMGLNAKLWRILRKWYKNLKCQVRVGDHISQAFQVLVGVFQGGKWSSRLFQAYYSELINMLCSTLIGCNIYDLRAVCPTYADDIAILAPFKITLQNLLSLVDEFANKWRLQFNPSKCMYMVFSRKNIPRSLPDVTLDGKCIECTTYIKHLGAGIGEEQLIVQEMVQKGRVAFYALLSLGSKIGGVNPVVATKIYWSTVIPSMMYGIEVLCLSESAMERLEQEHRNFGKRLQYLPNNTSNPAAYSLLGWKSLQAYSDMTVLSFYYTILTMQSSCIFKKLLLRRLIDISMSGPQKSGPIGHFVKTCVKYGLLHHIWDVVRSGNTMQCSQFKALCKSAVARREQTVHNIELLMYEKLKLMRNTPIEIHPWWQVSQAFPRSLVACKLMVKLLVGEEPLRYNTGRQEYPRSVQNQLCNICKNGDLETTMHFLYICEPLAVSRITFVNLLKAARPDGEQLIRAKNVQEVLRADTTVGIQRVDYLYNLSLIAESVHSMFLHRKHYMQVG